MRIEYFQLIDRITALNIADKTIRTEATVPTSSTIFEGHFPGYPLMPGVLLTEAMAQTSGWLIIAITRFDRMPFLAALKDVKLRTFVSPGERLALSAKLIMRARAMLSPRPRSKRDGKVVCDATITFRVMPFPNPAFRVSMQKTAEGLAFPMEAVGNA